MSTIGPGVRATLEGSTAELGEFEAAFPPISGARPEGPPAHGPAAAIAAAGTTTATAIQATMLLREMAAWIGGLIDELTFEDKMKADADARARYQVDPMPGSPPQAGSIGSH